MIRTQLNKRFMLQGAGKQYEKKRQKHISGSYARADNGEKKCAFGFNSFSGLHDCVI